jgi:glycerol-3-phosphate acyltransferase PlsY
VLGYICLVVGAYLLGSIPTGYLVARAKGIDIRTVGSGNIGATNAFRVLGKPAGIFVLLADALKGFAACTLLTNLILHAFDVPVSPFKAAMTERVIAGIVAVLGHNFTCWLRFKGGKGIATTAGVYFAVAPISVGIALGLWILVFVATRYVSLASIVAAIALPTAVWINHYHSSVALGIATTAIGAMAVWKHKANIARLKAGTENRIEFGKKPTEGKPT